MNAPCPACGTPRNAPDARFCQRCGQRFDGVGPDDPLVGATLLGRYKVSRRLGEGTMGRVYLGEQPVGEATRPVAIKVLAAARGNDDYIVARFRREASMIASLEHPNIIRLYDYGEENGLFVSVMEFVSGGSLAAKLALGGVAPALAEAYAWQIARALDEAHRQGIFHRDLKPENVLLAPSANPDEPETLKVVDFGIAHRPPAPGERALTNVGTVLGTPAYMAPEQLRGEPVDARSDVYALALVTYQLLAGALPWPAQSLADWTDAHLNRPPAPLRAQPGCAALPERYDAALTHALEKDPERRTPSTLAFVRELSGGDGPNVEPAPAAPAPPARSETLMLDAPPPPMAAAPGVPPPPAMPPPATPPPAGYSPSLEPFAPPSRRRAAGPLVFALVGAVSVTAGFIAVWSALKARDQRDANHVGAEVGAQAASADAGARAPTLAPTPAPAPATPPAVLPRGPDASVVDHVARRSEALQRESRRSGAQALANAGMAQLRSGRLRPAIVSLRRADAMCQPANCDRPSEMSRLRERLGVDGDSFVTQMLRERGQPGCNDARTLVRELETVRAGAAARRTLQSKCPPR
ncbi:MAG: serine/threonine-protein kinase [Polyangiales bacterium]